MCYCEFMKVIFFYVCGDERYGNIVLDVIDLDLGWDECEYSRD